MRIEDFSKFILERYSITEKRRKGIPPPWTDDPILREYKFCNVHREDDSTTIFIRNNILKPNYGYKDLWFASAICRFFNRIESLKYIGFQGDFSKDRLMKITRELKAKGIPIFNTAYLITTNGSTGEKVELLCDLVFKPMWERRDEIRYSAGEFLQIFYTRLMTLNGVKSFLAGQIIADVKYDSAYRQAEDWNSFVAIGPGSKRGLNRVLGRDKKAKLSDFEFYESFKELFNEVQPIISKAGLPETHAQDIQNCLCEFDKYERVRLNEEGRVRRFSMPNKFQTISLPFSTE